MKKSKINTPVITGDKDTDASLDMERINQELPKNEVALHSVGSVLDTEVAVLYPMNKDGSADYGSAFCLEDVDGQWFEELSEADYLIAHQTMISFSNAKDVVLLKRYCEDSYLVIKELCSLIKTDLGSRDSLDLLRAESLMRRLKAMLGFGRWTTFTRGESQNNEKR